RVRVGKEPMHHGVVAVEPVGQQADDLRGHPSQHVHLVRRESRHHVVAVAPEHGHDWSTVAHRPWPCNWHASYSIRSRAPRETTALPLWCTSSISFSACSRL